MREEPLIFGCFNEREAPLFLPVSSLRCSKERRGFQHGCSNERRSPLFGLLQREKRLSTGCNDERRRLVPYGWLSICPVPREERHPREDPCRPSLNTVISEGQGIFWGGLQPPRGDLPRPFREIAQKSLLRVCFWSR